LLHRIVFEREIRDDASQSSILVIDGSSTRDFAALHATVFGFPHIRVRAAAAGEFHERCARIALLENRDDLLGESRLAHESFPFAISA